MPGNPLGILEGYVVKVRLEHAFQIDTFKIWFYERGPNGVRLYQTEPGNLWRIEEVPEGAILSEPSLTLPTDMLTALIAEASDHLPPSAATDRHLQDAQTTRDRLLAMIEKRGLR